MAGYLDGDSTKVKEFILVPSYKMDSLPKHHSSDDIFDEEESTASPDKSNKPELSAKDNSKTSLDADVIHNGQKTVNLESRPPPNKTQPHPAHSSEPHKIQHELHLNITSPPMYTTPPKNQDHLMEIEDDHMPDHSHINQDHHHLTNNHHNHLTNQHHFNPEQDHHSHLSKEDHPHHTKQDHAVTKPRDLPDKISQQSTDQTGDEKRYHVYPSTSTAQSKKKKKRDISLGERRKRLRELWINM